MQIYLEINTGVPPQLILYREFKQVIFNYLVRFEIWYKNVYLIASATPILEITNIYKPIFRLKG